MRFAIRFRVSGVNRVTSKLLGNAKIAVAGALVCLAGAQAATAAPITGSMGVVVNPFAASSASFTSSSLTLNAQNLITTAESGDFATQIPSQIISSFPRPTRFSRLQGQRLTIDLTSIWRRLRKPHSVLVPPVFMER